MSYRHTLNAAIESLHEIEDLVKGFPMDGNIPSVEIDLTLQKIRNIYELMLMLKKPREDELAATAVAVEKTVLTATPPAIATAPTTATDTVTVPANKPPKETQTLSDRFKGQPTLHESLHQRLTQEGNTLSQAKPVKNLLAAIGINDRFTFIRELFNNDTASFENTINILNSTSGFNDARNYIIQHFDWDMDSEAVRQLLEIMRRKYITGKHE